jgi:hypothetical protein
MMRSRTLVPLLVTAALGSGCVENTAPGNDREAPLEPPAQPAQVAAVGEALENVATGALYPQTMTEADLGTVPELADRCVFRFTRVGLPVFVYGSTTGVIKLNDRLVLLPARGAGAYVEGAVRVDVRPLEEGNPGDPLLTELVLRIEGAPNALGFHGFARCPGRDGG